jgi:hypothetical protein
MQYKLTRYEKYKDKDGNITSIFIAVSVDDENGNTLIQEKWLTQEEVASVLENESNLLPIIENVAAEGQLRLEEEIANKPQPPEIADLEKLNSFNINISNINKKVENRKEKKVNEHRNS